MGIKSPMDWVNTDNLYIYYCLANCGIMTFGILTISYQRTKVLHLFLAGIERLRMEIGIQFPCVVVGDAEHASLCERSNVHHITQENHPASRKFNMGVDYLMSIGCDYIVISGSDDIFSTSLLKNLISEMEKGTDLIGVNTVYFYAGDGKYRGTLIRIETTQLLGVARCISANIIKQVGRLWTRDKSWGMDGDCMRNILPYVKTKTIVEGKIVDVKTQDNLNKFSFWMGKTNNRISPQEFYEFISEEEKQILAEL